MKEIKEKKTNAIIFPPRIAYLEPFSTSVSARLVIRITADRFHKKKTKQKNPEN